MIFLIGSIIFTSYLTLWFKVIERLKIPSTQVIVYNYFTCVITGSIVNGHFPINNETVHQPWFKWAIIMGIIFISLFHVIGYTAQKVGIAVASVANKLSLVVPFIFSIYLYNDEATWLKITGVVLALVSVLLTCWPSKDQSKHKVSTATIVVLAATLFVVSGLLDTMIKYVEHSFINDSNKNDYLITAFAAASASGIFFLLYVHLIRRERFSLRAVWAGIALGVPNYFSIWCLVQVLKAYGDNSSAIIPINNMGIVLFSTVVAWWLFKEKLSSLNWTGIFLALIAIAMIAYG